MAVDTQQGIRNAADQAADAADRAKILALAGRPVVESEIGPVVRGLIAQWDSALKPILLLEGVRLAEAIELLAGVADPLPVLGLTKEQVPLLVQVGFPTKIDEIALRQEAERITALPGQPESVRRGAELLMAVADDCAGPLGAIYSRNR